MSISALHPSMLEKLDPEYATYYNAHLADKPGLHQIPWSPTLRQQPPQPGGSEPVKVGSVHDIQLTNCDCRVFTPDGLPPSSGWPALLYFHGGGWTLGNIETESSFCSNVCKRCRTIVVSVAYRLGPENPYPAAVLDAEEAFSWLLERGARELNLDTSRVGLGGSSSGGNLATVLTHKLARQSRSKSLLYQVLIVPVTDNTADVEGTGHASWAENKYAASLTPEKMLWFRRNYLPLESDWGNADASPLHAPSELFSDCPPCYIAVCDLDILRDEGIAYGKKLLLAGVRVEIKNYKRAPHPIMAMDGKQINIRPQTVRRAAAFIHHRSFGDWSSTDFGCLLCHLGVP